MSHMVTGYCHFNIFYTIEGLKHSLYLDILVDLYLHIDSIYLKGNGTKL